MLLAIIENKWDVKLKYYLHQQQGATENIEEGIRY